MGKYHKYAVFINMHNLTELNKTINQLKTIENPTQLINQLTENLVCIDRDFTTKLKKFPTVYNDMNIQLTINFYDF